MLGVAPRLPAIDRNAHHIPLANDVRLRNDVRGQYATPSGLKAITGSTGRVDRFEITARLWSRLSTPETARSSRWCRRQRIVGPPGPSLRRWNRSRRGNRWRKRSGFGIGGVHCNRGFIWGVVQPRLENPLLFGLVARWRRVQAQRSIGEECVERGGTAKTGCSCGGVERVLVIFHRPGRIDVHIEHGLLLQPLERSGLLDFGLERRRIHGLVRASTNGRTDAHEVNGPERKRRRTFAWAFALSPCNSSVGVRSIRSNQYHRSLRLESADRRVTRPPMPFRYATSVQSTNAA